MKSRRLVKIGAEAVVQTAALRAALFHHLTRCLDKIGALGKRHFKRNPDLDHGRKQEAARVIPSLLHAICRPDDSRRETPPRAIPRARFCWRPIPSVARTF